PTDTPTFPYTTLFRSVFPRAADQPHPAQHPQRSQGKIRAHRKHRHKPPHPAVFGRHGNPMRDGIEGGPNTHSRAANQDVSFPSRDRKSTRLNSSHVAI